MSSNNTTTEQKSNNPFDIFIVGTKKGFNIGMYSLLPNVLMAFVLTYVLQLFGVMAFLGEYCGGIMAVFGLPGEALTVLLATWLSCGAGVGVEFRLSGKLGLYLDPGVRYYFPNSQPKSIRTDKPFMFNFDAGLRFSL